MARNSAVGEKAYENILKDVTIASVSSDDFLSKYLESSGIARAGFDKARRRVEAVVAEERDRGGLELPEPGGGYPMFPGRRVADPIEWYREHWARFVPVGLDQAALQRLDGKLMGALDNAFRGQREKLRGLVPSTADQNSALLKSLFGTDFAGNNAARRHALAAIAAARMK